MFEQIFRNIDDVLLNEPIRVREWRRRSMTESRQRLCHFLGALAYRTQKALRSAPESFGDFSAGKYTRTPHELVWHMTGVIGQTRTS